MQPLVGVTGLFRVSLGEAYAAYASEIAAESACHMHCETIAYP